MGAHDDRITHAEGETDGGAGRAVVPQPGDCRAGREDAGGVRSGEVTAELTAAYSTCRAIAKREAKNFYYAFRVLPQAKSDAMCAIYAFMRRADDISDDETMTIPQRRAVMTSWLDAWRESAEEPTLDPVFLAVRDTQRRFGITDELLE